MFKLTDTTLVNFLATKMVVITIAFLSMGCVSTVGRETQQYQRLKSTYKFRAYEKMSAKYVQPALQKASLEIEDPSISVDIPVVHSFVSLFLVLDEKTEMALAESEYAKEMALKYNDSKFNKVIATHALAFAMLNKDWLALSRQHLTHSDKYFALYQLSSPTYKELVYKITQGLIAVHNADIENSGKHFQLLSNLSEQPWLPKAFETLAALSCGNTLKNELCDLNGFSSIVCNDIQKLQSLRNQLAFNELNDDLNNKKQWIVERNHIIKRWLLNSLNRIEDEQVRNLTAHIQSFMKRIY